MGIYLNLQCFIILILFFSLVLTAMSTIVTILYCYKGSTKGRRCIIDCVQKYSKCLCIRPRRNKMSVNVTSSVMGLKNLHEDFTISNEEDEFTLEL